MQFSFTTFLFLKKMRHHSLTFIVFFSENSESPRKELLHNIDILTPPVGKRLYQDTFDTRTRAAIRVGDYKLITGNPGRRNNTAYHAQKY